MKQIWISGLFTLLCAGFAQAQVDFPVQAPKNGAANAKRTKTKSQSHLAQKGVFPVVKATDARLKRAVSATNLAAATKLRGQNAQFVGVVTKVFAPGSGAIVLLNFAKNYKTALVGVIKAKDFARFPNLQNLANKRVLLTGKVVNYKGQTEIELTKSGAICVVR